MPKRTLARHARHGTGWAHPYSTGPFDPYLYADGGDGDGSASGSGADQSGGQAADQGGDQSGQTDGSGSDSGQGSGQQSGKGSTGDQAAMVEQLKKDLAAARKEAAKDRTTAKQQAADEAVKALTEKLGKALGLVKDDVPPDPAALAKAIEQKDAALTERESQLRAKDVELAVWTRADKAGAKAGALLDSRSFLRQIADLDPADKGFTKALDDAITAAVKDNASFAVQSASRSGGDLSGGTGETNAKGRSGSLSGAVSHHYQT